MEHRHLAAFHKIVSVLSSFTLLFQSILPAASIPLLFANQVSAEEATQSASEPTPATTPTEQPTPSLFPTTTQTPTQEITPTPTEEVSPAPTAEVTPTATPEPTVTIAPTEQAAPAAAPTQGDVPAPTGSEPPHETSPPDQQNNAPQEAPTPTDTPTPTITPEQPVQGHLEAVVLNNVDAETLDLDAGNTITSATLTTDKADYAPTDTALISGTGFTPNTTYSLTVSSDDPPATSTTVDVTADETGNFLYAYQLDGTYRPNYKVAVTNQGGKVIAETTFTDSAAVNEFSQCSNDTGTGYTSGDTGCQWINGNLQSNNSAYYEGDATPQRLYLSGLTNGNHTVTIKYGTTKGGKHAYDYVTDDTFSESWITDDDFCESLSGFDDCSSLTENSSTLISTDPNAAGFDVAQANRHFKIRNGTFTSIGTPTLVNGSYAGDSETTILISLNVDTNSCANRVVGHGQNPDSCPVLITWGEHVSRQSDWGAGNSAVNISGSPYHISLETIDGSSAGSRDNQMQAGAIKGSITLDKVTSLSGDPTSFSFSTTGFSANTTPSLTDTTTPVVWSNLENSTKPNGNSDPNKTYTIVENPVSGWTLSSKNCTGATSSVITQITNGVSITLGNGENVTCTFTNTQESATITVNKTLVPTNDPSLFNLQIDDSTAGTGGDVGNGGTTGAVTVNTTSQHTVSEIARPGTSLSDYTTTYSCNNNLSGNGTSVPAFSVTNGQNVICTFTNTRNTGSVVVHKLIDTDGVNQYETNDTGANTLGFRWGLDAGSVINLMGATVTPVNTGNHSVTENDGSVADYHFVGWFPSASTQYSCTKPQGTTLPVSVNVSANTTTDITLCNAINTGTVLVHKDVQGPGGEDVTDNSNYFEVSLDAGTGQPISDNITVTYNNVPVGSHTIKESSIDPDYTLYGISTTPGAIGTPAGLSVSVAEGQTVHVYVTNRQHSGKVTVVKDVVNPDGGAVSDSHSFTANLNPESQSSPFAEGSNAVFTVNPGEYTVSESADVDYTDLGCKLATGKPATFTVASGEEITITCTNQQKKATITVVKDVRLANGSDISDTHGFSVTLNSETKPFAEETNAVFSVNPGTYGAVEGEDANYTPVSNDGPKIVGSNGSATITIVNWQNPGTISGYKYEDADGDVLTAGDRTPVTNWTIELWQNITSSWSKLTETLTDILGKFSFTNLISGNYEVREVVPTPGWTALSPTGVPVTLGAGDESEDNNFVNFHNVSISGQKFNDLDGQGDKDEAEPGLINWKIFLDTNGNGTWEEGEPFQLTDANGNYSFSDINPGTYKVREVGQNGWAQTTANPADISVVSGRNVTGVDFGNFNFGQISGTKYNDVNDNGEDDPGEAELSGWTIYLDTNGDGNMDLGETSTTTDANGDYVFSNLGPGTYTVREVQQTGWTQTDPTSADSSIGGQDDGSYVVTMTSNGNKTQRNFGNRQLLGDIIVHKELDTDGNGVFDDGGDSEANTLGFFWGFDTDSTLTRQMGASATDLPTTDYNITENDGDVAGYHFTGWYDTNTNNGSSCEEPDGEELPAAVTVNDGQTTEITLCNTRDTADITVIKNIDGNNDGDLDDAVDQTNVNGWTWDITGGKQNISMGDSRTLVTDTYTITEDEKPGDYAFVSWSCDNDTSGTTNSISLTLTKDNPVVCEFVNTPVSDVHGYKWNDADGDGQRGEENRLGDWTIFLDENGDGKLNQNEQSAQTEADSESNDFGWYWFFNLLPGNYRICEVTQSGWQQTYPTDPTCHEITLPETGEQTENRVIAVEHNFGNQQVNPILTLAKSNNAVGDKAPGSDVLFTLTVTATQSAVNNVIVKDLPSAGFTYRAGSWSAKKNGVPFSLTEPVYASPGTWNIGNMNADDVVELQYIADIATSQQSGTYRDLAWATGTSVLASEVLANNDTGVFVGTDVAVNSGDNPNTSVNIIREEKKETTGQVLGAATELPATGGNTLWLILASVLFVFGGGSIVAGITLERSAKGRSSSGRKRRLHA